MSTTNLPAASEQPVTAEEGRWIRLMLDEVSREKMHDEDTCPHLKRSMRELASKIAKSIHPAHDDDYIALAVPLSWLSVFETPAPRYLPNDGALPCFSCFDQHGVQIPVWPSDERRLCAACAEFVEATRDQLLCVVRSCFLGQDERSFEAEQRFDRARQCEMLEINLDK
jgi:hypothetical protein